MPCIAEKVYCSRSEISDYSDAVKILCTSGKCDRSGFMHSDCFNKEHFTNIDIF